MEQSLGRPCRQTDGRSKRTCELTSSIVARGTSFHRRAELECLLSDVIFYGDHAATADCSLVQRNSVPSTHIRCMITANRRASATTAFFSPRRLAIVIAQALSQDQSSCAPVGCGLLCRASPASSHLRNTPKAAGRLPHLSRVNRTNGQNQRPCRPMAICDNPYLHARIELSCSHSFN